MKLISKITGSLVFLACLFSSCKKEIPVDLNLENPSDSTDNVAEIKGTQWTSLFSSFFANEEAQALGVVGDELLFTYLDLSSISGVISGSEIIEHGQTLGSGFGIEKIQVADGVTYGVGALGIYGAYSYNPGDVNPWNGAVSVGTNMYSIERYGDHVYAACGVAPHIRSNSSGTFQEVGDGLDGKVNDLLTFNGKLYAGGSFDNSGSTVLNGVAVWNGSTWSAMGQGFNGEVRDLVEYDGKVIALGNFTESVGGNTDCKFIAQWNGSSWEDLDGGLNGGFQGAIKGESYGNQLIVGGEFSGSNSVASNNVIKWNGTEWVSLNGGVSDKVEELAIYQGKLHVASSNSSGSNYLLRLD